MEYTGPDNVGDILRGDSGTVLQSCSASTNTKLVDSYCAVPLFGRSGDTSISMQILLCDLCSVCIWQPLFLHGHCCCQVDSYCNGDIKDV